MSMNASQARVVDPVLSGHVRGYKNAGRVGNLLFPSVDVPVSAGKIIEFGYEGKPYALVQDSLEGKVPREFARDAMTVPGIDLGMRAANNVMNALTLTLEYEQAKMATTPANFGGNTEVLAGTSKWSHDDSRPTVAVADARQSIRSACGIYPNVMVCRPSAFTALKNNKSIGAVFKNVDIITPTMLAALLELDQVVESQSMTANDAGEFQDVWGNYAVLAYVPQSPGGFEEPSFGYTYTMKGHPFVEEPYWENNVKSWIYGVTYERAPVLAGMSAGFLFQSVA